MGGLQLQYHGRLWFTKSLKISLGMFSDERIVNNLVKAEK